VQRWNFRIPSRLFMLAVWSIITSVVFAQGISRRYVLILDDPPVTSRFPSRAAIATTAAAQYRQQIAGRQSALRQQLATRHFTVTGSVSTLLNAMFVATTPDRVAELKTLPGVRGVIPVRHFHRNLNRATQLVNAPAAWAALGGVTNAGAGIRIAILDTGIDQTHPALQDPTLPAPAAFTPVCDPTRINTCSQSAFTTNKVIVARSYVGFLAAGGAIDPNHPELDSRPDDISPQDHEGHGTALASCAAGVPGTVTPSLATGGSGTVTIGGVAPKAWLGNYRIYGSPQVNDTTTDDIMIMALEDAVADGMDVVSLSSGGPALFGPLDTGAVCGQAAGVPCDPVAMAFENAAEAGTIITVSAGNDGAPGTIESPGDAPSVITLGATTSSHYFTPTASAVGAGAPSNLQNLVSDVFPDNFIVGAATGPLRDVTTVGDDGTACNALPAFSLPGYIALIERGNCTFAAKVLNAIAAGAIGVLLYDNGGSISPSYTVGTSGGYVPVGMISQSDGANMKAYIDANPNALVTVDPDGAEQDDSSDANLYATFSSEGPNVGPLLAKPELVAPGESPQSPNTVSPTGFYYGGVYMAAQTYDPLGVLYSSTGFAAAEGTSFSTPITAGAAALVLQANPNVTGAARLALVRSYLIDNAAQSVTGDDYDNPVDGFEIGAGLLNAGGAVASTVSVAPATLSFGVLSNTVPAAQQLTITNNGSSPATLALAVVPNTTLEFASTLTMNLSTPSLSLAAGASGVVTVTPTGSFPSPGYYSGVITIAGTGVSLVVPYVYILGDGFPGNILYPPCIGQGTSCFDGTVGQDIPNAEPYLQLVDDDGLPIAGAPVTWSVSSDTTTLPSIVSADSATNQYGYAFIYQVTLGSQPGDYAFTATVAGASQDFTGYARAVPTLRVSDPVENAASGEVTIAPGSYAALYGTALSDPGDVAISNTLRLPLAIDYVNVSFDVPSAGISVPGHLTYAGPGQVNVQVPWELQGQTSALVKVTIDDSPSAPVTVPIQPFAPAFYGPPGMVAARDTSFIQISQSHPAVRGQYVQLYVTGLGPVTNQPASGEAASISGAPLCKTTNPVTVTIGPAPGEAVTADFSGLAPGNAGLYQVNFLVPTDLQPGNQPMTITVGGVTSPASAMWVQ
jgi:minor extracellular serine protease Vpr